MPLNNNDKLCVNTIRILAIDAVEAAKSGHPGMPMGMADAAFVLWTKFLKHNPADPDFIDRDRFILSAGHGSMLIYALLHLTGYDLSLEEIKNFRQLGSLTPGHPEFGLTPGVELTTGPLGQGFATGVGMAMAEAFLSAKFNTPDTTIIDHYTYAIVSDGDLMEGISHEAASLAGHLKLGKLIYLYDSNQISIDGDTNLAFTDDTMKRFEAYGWQTQQIDGHDHKAIEQAIKNAQKSDKPSIIECKTKIGFGSPNKEGKASSHGAPLGEDEVELTKQKLNWKGREPFVVPDEVSEYMDATNRGKQWQEQWQAKCREYKQRYPEKWEAFNAYLNKKLDLDWENVLPVFEENAVGMATRKASGKTLQKLADVIPNLVGGSADLTGSNKTELVGYPVFEADNYAGQNIHYGVREHAMAAAMNGMALHKGVIPFAGTFLVFSDYNKPAIRIAALTETPSIFVFTHDSIGLGEDGPTHQPIEHLAALRATPNVTVIRPADANETAWAWKAALENRNGPTALILTRQSLPVIKRTGENTASATTKGAYIVKKEKGNLPDLILMATGSELQLTLDAAVKMEQNGYAVRVVSMPSWELFQKQSEAYQQAILPSGVQNRISVEAAATLGWDRWIGPKGKAVGIDRFGMSAPYQQVYKTLGLTVERIVDEAKEIIEAG